MKVKEKYLTVQDLNFLADRVEKIIKLCHEKNEQEIEEVKETIMSMYDFDIDIDKEHCYVFLIYNQYYDYE